MKTERECVEAVQTAYARMKEACSDAQEAILALMAHNRGEESFLDRNAAYLSLGELESLGGKMKELHSAQTTRLAVHFPEYLGLVATGGGGR